MAVAVGIVVVVTAAVRVIPGMVWRRRGMDAGYHLLLRREIRRNGMRMPARVPAMALDARQTYPWGYHLLLALLPERWIRGAPPLPSTLIDTAHALLVFALALHVAPIALPGSDAVPIALLAALLFATAPALLVVGIGPRAYEVTPRPLGELLYSALMAATGMLMAGGDPRWIGAAALAGGAMLLSSKFAGQVLVACALPCAVLTGSVWPLALPPAAVVAALVMSGGRYRWILEAHVRHLAIYYRRLQDEHSVLAERNDLSLLGRAAAHVLRAPRDPAARAELARLAEQSTILQFLLRNVLWYATVLLVVIGVTPMWSGALEWRGWLLAWAVTPIIPFVVSSVRRWRFLGEAERYPEYGISAVAVVAAIALASVPASARTLALVAYALLSAPSMIYSIARQRWNLRRAVWGPELDELIAFLRTEPGSAVILPIPWFAAYVLAPETEHRFLASNDGTVWQKAYDQMFAKYPWPATDIGWWRTRHGAELALVETALLGEAAEAGVVYDLAGLPVRFENGRFRVYALA
jgi:hypothetical protein